MLVEGFSFRRIPSFFKQFFLVCPGAAGDLTASFISFRRSIRPDDSAFVSCVHVGILVLGHADLDVLRFVSDPRPCGAQRAAGPLCTARPRLAQNRRSARPSGDHRLY